MPSLGPGEAWALLPVFAQALEETESLDKACLNRDATARGVRRLHDQKNAKNKGLENQLKSVKTNENQLTNMIIYTIYL